MSEYGKLDDSSLIALAKTGDIGAYDQLVKNHSNTVATVAINMLKDYNDAEDVGQQVFIKLYQSLNNFRGDSSLKTYITRMTMNYCLNELKRRGRFWSRNIQIDGAKHIEQVSEDTDNKELIKKALQHVDSKFRSVLVLRNIEGYSSQETADILGVPLGTVLSRQKRGMEKMKDILINKLGYGGE